MSPTTFYNVFDYDFLIPFIENTDAIFNEIKMAMGKNEVVGTTLNAKSEVIDGNLVMNMDGVDHYTFHWAEDNGILHTSYPEGGAYNVLTIYKKDFLIKTCNIPELFPILTQLLSNVPNLYYSSFAKADPFSTLIPHSHNRRHLVFHLLLNDLKNEGCVMKCGDDQRILQKKGDTVLFDYSICHSTANNSSSERFNLLVDFNPFTI